MASCGRGSPQPNTAEDPHLQRSVTKRMHTFLDCPADRIGYIPIADLADNGFVYSTATGTIRCVWCGATLTDLDGLDSIAVIQQLHNENCPRGPPLDEPQTVPQAPSGAEDQIEGPEIDLGGPESSQSSGEVNLLRRDNERMKEKTRCKQCLGAHVETLFLPCRHLVACERCADRVDDCFVCGTKILGTVRVYMI